MSEIKTVRLKDDNYKMLRTIQHNLLIEDNIEISMSELNLILCNTGYNLGKDKLIQAIKGN